jgi:glutamine transport system substrate-binding protein
MKKWLTICLAIVFVAALAGCGKSKETNGGPSKETPKETTMETPKETIYHIATDAQYAPMESMDKDKIVGLDIDFLAEVMKEAGLKYEISNTGWDPMLLSVKSGTEYQAGISAISITDERKQTYDYTVPYFESENMIIVKEGSPIKSALDLKDKKVAVQLGTTADTLMSKIMGNDNSSLKKFESNTVALLELQKGGVDSVVADFVVILDYIKNNPKEKFVSVEDKVNFSSEFYGILLPKGSELKAKLDPAIKKVVEGSNYKEAYKKWTGKDLDTTKLLEQFK